MKLPFLLAAGFLTAVSLPLAAQAQGLVGGAQQGAHEGNRVAGPVGAVLGGAVGAGVGTVNGALGIRPAHGPRCYYRHGHRRCRW
jgi:uncharacterized protein YcfJ